MKNLLMVVYSPAELGIAPEDVCKELVQNYCIRVRKYTNEGLALMAYVDTPCWCSTLLDENSYPSLLEKVTEAILNGNYAWLDENIRQIDYVGIYSMEK